MSILSIRWLHWFWLAPCLILALPVILGAATGIAIMHIISTHCGRSISNHTRA
jgi:hypothetical protein